jgi:hypothetical protein
VRFLSDLASSASDPVLAASPDGSTLAVWRFSKGVTTVAQARRMRADDTLGDAQVISPQSAVPTADRQVGDELGLAAMRDGRAIAVWDTFAPGSPDPNPGRVAAAISAPALFVPGPPLGVGATAGDASATVAWSPPASDGGLPITSFTATASPGGASCTTSATTCTIGGLQNGVPHTVTVTATNSLGTGAPSQPSASFTPLAPVPPPPVLRLTGVRVTPAVVVRGRPAQTTRVLRIRATLNRPAASAELVERRLPGLRRGRACVAPTLALRRARAVVCAVRVGGRGEPRRAGGAEHDLDRAPARRGTHPGPGPLPGYGERHRPALAGAPRVAPADREVGGALTAPRARGQVAGVASISIVTCADVSVDGFATVTGT